MTQNGTDTNSLKELLHYRFNDEKLLERSLTTTGYINENPNVQLDQTPLSTLGDAVLGAIIADRAFHEGSTAEQITECKRQNGANIALAQLAKSMSLELLEYIKCGQGEYPRLDAYERCPMESISDDAKGGRKIYADTMEAIIGAIYLDAGYDSAKEIVDRWLS